MKLIKIIDNKLIKTSKSSDPMCEMVAKPRLCLDGVSADLCHSVGCLWCPGGPQDMNDLECIWPDV